MAVKYIPYFPNTLEGQALLDNFVRTKRILRYRDNDKVIDSIERGMPLFEVETKERIGINAQENLVIRGECLSACAYLKEKGVQVDLVYIDPPFASGADYAKKIYVRRNPKVAEAIVRAEAELDIEELRTFEEKMYGDVWDKERYLNWMYENLMAIKSVMSDDATVFVHLDYNIAHYVKILLDEVFGEDRFLNNIVWCYQTRQFSKNYFNRKHHDIFWYSHSDNYVFNWDAPGVLQEYSEATIKKYKLKDEKGYYRLCGRGIEGSPIKGAKDVDPKWEIEHPELVVRDYLGEGFAPSDYWNIDIVNQASNERTDYATQKPEALLEKIVRAASKEGMVVADFFGGSGVTAAVAARLGRKFIHCDIGINSIQTTRDRLISQKAEFDVLEVNDGVSLYRNPVQTMDKLKALIKGLRNEDSLDKFWEGSIVDTKYGMMPVYLPNLMDGTTRLLDKPLMNRIIREAMPELPENTKRVIVYYIDIIDREEIEKFITEQNDRTTIEIELRDLKQILDEVVVEDEAQWHLEETKDGLWSGWKVVIDTFHSDRVLKKIEEVNFKGEQQAIQQKAKGKEKEFNPIVISDEGLETIEWLSVDFSTADKDAAWHSDAEIKIDRLGFVILNGIKTQDFWDGSIKCEQKPLRLKIRNICGDESTFVIQ